MSKCIAATLFLTLAMQVCTADEPEVSKRFEAANAAYVEALEQYHAGKTESLASELLRSASELHAISKEIYPADDPQMFVFEAVYGNALVVSQEFKAAKVLLTAALPGLERVFGEDSAQLVPAILSLANANGGMGESLEQIRLYRRALKIVEIQYGESSSEHEELKATIVEMAKAYPSDPSIASFVEPLLPYLPTVTATPRYPKRALSQRLEGFVDLSFTVTTSGRVKDPIVLSSSSPLFETAAISAVRRFSYTPRIKDGVPVEVHGVKTRILFDLTE